MTANTFSRPHGSNRLSNEELEAGGLMLYEALIFQAGPTRGSHAGHSRHGGVSSGASQGAPKTHGPANGRKFDAKTGGADEG